MVAKKQPPTSAAQKRTSKPAKSDSTTVESDQSESGVPATTAVSEDAAQKEKERKAKRAAITADLMTRPSFLSAQTSMSFIPYSMTPYGGTDMVSMFREIQGTVQKVVSGDMTTPEALLVSQAMSLNAIYNECASLAGINIAQRLPQARS